ncbi:hypothetical protein DBR37_06485 [Herminiimonas sp. KBW02]|uniref:hypothetical protein n=1 Tax=Herminiimonas sp. KBW02 TaxID=2153363 RepID=UPI000F5B5F55|nr:hypothetical protein [Herminiimonas sp. KBW02]RQO35989.1 hypothetical protein DBR37_06485 [Herminiimonas sp. KBW02]
MSRVPDTVYKGYEIFTIVVPVSEGLWSATSEIEINGAQGEEISQGFAGPFEAHSRDAAKEMVIAETKQKIDDLLARPV